MCWLLLVVGCMSVDCLRVLFVVCCLLFVRVVC